MSNTHVLTQKRRVGGLTLLHSWLSLIAVALHGAVQQSCTSPGPAPVPAGIGRRPARADRTAPWRPFGAVRGTAHLRTACGGEAAVGGAVGGVGWGLLQVGKDIMQLVVHTACTASGESTQPTS